MTTTVTQRAVQGVSIKKLLIANRGEIAMRILRTARAMGMQTVAVYSDSDADAAHVAAADQAVCIGGALPAESYLNIDNILDAAKRTGADAIHPGYGFLSENARFAEACSAAGLIFVGPSAQAIRAMGDKAGAKALMAKAGVPCVPGYQGADQSDDRLRAAAAEIGYPVMIKASAGGGGRGMRLVTDADKFDDALRAARSEAMAGFSDDRMLIERAILAPRHIEIQILADSHGSAVHLGERDCSVQRRHQKLIEEAPSPAVSDALRNQMGQVALKAVQAIGYVGAGTLEFLLDTDGQFYFMEMNTRLQVEHPVTEAVTGLDLVALQLRIAGGDPLGVSQSDIQMTGHAIEVRLCAEDAAAGFIPQSGQIGTWHPPADLRVDHALADGALVPAQYDSMLAKLIAHGPDRETARLRLLRGLETLRIDGIRTNQGILGDCLSVPDFRAGHATTGFIGDVLDVVLAREKESERAAAMRVAALVHATDVLPHGFPTPMRLGRDDRVCEVQVMCTPNRTCRVTCGGQTLEIRVRADGRPEVDGVQETARLTRVNGGLWLHWSGRAWDFRDLSFAAEQADQTGSGVIRAVMTGRVGAIMVGVGDVVAQGDTLLVLEAMKMEHAHVADLSGTITAVHARTGDQVGAHRVLVEITPSE